jgi:subtilisin-like proprotein convertase family protein
MRTVVAHRLLALLAGLAVASPGMAQFRPFEVGPQLNIAIPDGLYRGTRETMGCSNLDVPASVAGTLAEVYVSFGVEHTYVGDLTMKLFSPRGTEINLFSRPGVNETADDGSTPPGETGYSANLAKAYLVTIFDGGTHDAERMGEGLADSQAVANFMIQAPDQFAPNHGAASAGNFRSFIGESPVGRWTLCVGDAVVGDSGSIDYWRLNIRTAVNPCAPGDQTLCLTPDTGTTVGRFRVTATWRTADGQTGAAQAIPLTTDTGYFWFFAPTNVEVVVKVLNACAGSKPRFWVFAGGLTNTRVDLIVEDTKTGARTVYGNPQGVAFKPIQDTSAFATCP